MNRYFWILGAFIALAALLAVGLGLARPGDEQVRGHPRIQQHRPIARAAERRAGRGPPPGEVAPRRLLGIFRGEGSGPRRQ